MTPPEQVHNTPPHAMLDVRTIADFLRGHVPFSANIPLEELAVRIHELPPRATPVEVLDTDESRLRQAAELLETRGYCVTARQMQPAELSEPGPNRVTLWSPSPLVEEVAHLAEAAVQDRPIRCADLGCGAGRDATFLAMRGWSVDGYDILPDALDRARALAKNCGVQFRGIVADLRKPFPGTLDRYHVWIAVRFRNSALLARLAGDCPPSTTVAVETFAPDDVKVVRRQDATRASLSDLLKIFDGWERVIANPSVGRDGRRFTQLIVRKP